MGYQKSPNFGSSSVGSSGFGSKKGKEGKCYSIANFAIAENSGRLPLLPHKYKISFYKGTTVTRIDPIDDNVHGFILEPFNRLLDKARVYHEHEVVDVIGSVVAIGDVVPVQSSIGRKIRRTVVIEDAESNQLDCTFWDHWATIIKELPEYDESQFMIEVFTPGKPVVTIAEFFHGVVKKMVSAIHECEHKSHCIVYAKIHKIHKESRWAYIACKKCNKKVDVVKTKATTSSGKSKVTFYYEDDGAVQAKSRIKSVALNESSITRVMDLHTPPSGMEASGSGQSSGGDKKRVFIDLDSIESEDEDESGSSKIPKLISVKIEKED
ncbi:replication protein A 70 kDa DNA-binding subunit B [Tanacetum coccineum]